MGNFCFSIFQFTSSTLYLLLSGFFNSKISVGYFFNTFIPSLATWCEELTHWKRPQCWEILKAGGEGDNRGWMASPTRWTWVWASSGRWWRTGNPGVLQSMWSQSMWSQSQTQMTKQQKLVTKSKLKSLELLVCWASFLLIWATAEHRNAESGVLVLFNRHSLGQVTAKFWRTGFWRQEVAGI